MRKNSTRNKLYYIFVITTVLLFHDSASLAQVHWSRVLQETMNIGQDSLLVQASDADYYHVNHDELQDILLTEETSGSITLPMPRGEKIDFSFERNTTLHPDLAEKFPSMGSFNIISHESRNTWGKMDVSDFGFHAMIFEPGESTVFILPVSRGDNNTYIVFRLDDYLSDYHLPCDVSGDDIRYFGSEITSGLRGEDYNECELNTYRIAVSTTGECAQSMGGTVESAMSEVMTSVNGLSGVLEKEFATTLTLVANNDELIFLNGNTDPFTNSSNSTMIVENQPVVDEIIGTSNYDIGHVFYSAGGGGVAFLESACNQANKAGGASGFNGGSPSAPGFLTLFGHEVGHQLAGTHSYNNSCGGNRTNSTAAEPGAGSTIMSYAGVCSPGMQNNADDYYHGVNMIQMGTDINDGCSFPSSLLNFSPVLEDLPVEIIIPASTPFILTAEATDTDGDILTYCWEQTDVEITEQPPIADAFEGPMFRSLPPSTSPSRFFPSLPSAQPNNWEVLPNGSRTMNFRVTVRDNAPGGSCTQYDDMVVIVDDSGGPFIVEVPSDNGIVWEAFTAETIVWDVANTNDEDFQGELVDILLSVDGGNSYPITLAEQVPNNGSFQLSEVPSFNTNLARVMVVNSARTFFDVSDNNFTILGGLNEGFELAVDDEIPVCQGNPVTYEIQSTQAFGFEENIELSLGSFPEGLEISFGQVSITAGSSTTLTLENTGILPIGLSEIELIGVAGEFESQIVLNIYVNEQNPEAVELLLPSNGTAGVSAIETFSWNASTSPLVTYTLEIATDPGFENLFVQFNNLTETTFEVGFLPLETELYWRVGLNGCGFVYSEPNSLLTDACQLIMSENVPLTIPTLSTTVESVININQAGTIEALRLTNLKGDHSRMQDLTLSLRSPAGTEVVLFDQICSSDDNFDLSFEDGANPNIDCPPTSGLFYAPQGSFSDFTGEEASGEWVLSITDSQIGVGGELQEWQLDICYQGSILSVDNESLNEISVFPNPTKGNVLVNMSTPGLYEFIEVFDLSGRLIQVQQIAEGETILEIDLAAEASGVYILSFRGNSGREFKRVLKSN
jgi:subtilisin-like proprotein convertase family protein